MTGRPILDAMEELTTKFQFCRNRVWAVAKTLFPTDRDLLLQIPLSQEIQHRGRHDGHGQCTFDFCEQSRLDFTAVGQRHENCESRSCESRLFEPRTLEEAARAGKPTAWRLDGKSMIESPEPFMALSHVWSDGTGSGAWPPGQANSCLYDFWKSIAEKFECEGIWWDTICIPKEKAARSKAIINIQRNYEDARITVIHDCFIREWDWVNGEIACFAIIMSPWFSRGWTALELARSRKVKVLFKGSVVKDLDQDILANPENSARHAIAAKVIQNLRTRGIDELNQLLAILGPRHTSWPRDLAIISGHLAGIAINPAASQQSLYQEILKKIGKVSHEHLFHNAAPMAKGFSWCPTSIFDMPQSSKISDLIIEKNGEISGHWAVFDKIERIPRDRYNWIGTHALIQSKLEVALNQPNRHLLLAPPDDLPVSKALLVEIVHLSTPKRVQFVGPVYYHYPIPRKEFGKGERSNVLIGDITGSERIDVKGPEFQQAALDGDIEKIRELLTNLKFRDEEKIQALHLAHLNDHRQVADLVLDELRKGSLRVNDGTTALHLAAQTGDAALVLNLSRVDGGYWNLCIQDQYSWTPLHYATWLGYEDVVNSAAWSTVSIGIQDRLGRNALHLAAERGNPAIACRLLSLICDSKTSNDDRHNCFAARCDDQQTVLHRAAWGGSATVVSLLLRLVEINAQDKDQKTALHVAAEKGNTAVVDLLLSLVGIQDKLQDSNEQTALHLAAQNGHEKIVPLLLNKGADLSLEDINGWTPLLLAAMHGHAGVARSLLEHGADVESLNVNSRTALLWAASKGHKEVVKVLVENGADLEDRDVNEQTALLAAAANGHVEVVELLVKEGADIESEDSSSQTPLLWAAERGHETVVKLLLEKGADSAICDRNGQWPLLAAAKKGSEGVVKLLLGLGPYYTHSGRDGSARTPLMWAAKMGHEPVVRLFIEYGAELDIKDKDNNTPLSLAVEGGNEAVVKLLLERAVEISPELGGDILEWAAEKGHATIVEMLLNNPQSLYMDYKRDCTPLARAVSHGHESIVRLLAAHGADLHCKDFSGRTPLSSAYHFNHPGILKVLLEHGARPESQEEGGQILLWALRKEHQVVAIPLIQNGAGLESKDKDGRTPLSLAAEKGYEGIVRELLARGAYIEARDRSNTFPLWWAARGGNGAVVKLLLDKGANIEASDSGMTALTGPALNLKHKEAVEMLLSYGASVSSNRWAGSDGLLWAAQSEIVQQLLNRTAQGIDPDYKGLVDDRTPLSLAAEKGYEKIVRMLLQHGAQIEARDKDGQTPLFYAAGNRDDAVVRLLIAHGAEVGAQDNYGRTALSQAEARGRKAVVRFLVHFSGGNN